MQWCWSGQDLISSVALPAGWALPACIVRIWLLAVLRLLFLCGQHIKVERGSVSALCALQDKKRLVFEGTVGADAEALGKLTEDDMRFLFH